MDGDNFILDDEDLYRSVRGKLEAAEYYHDDTGQLVFTPDAFRDRYKEPSVDRAKFRNFNPPSSKLNETDGIVSLVTENVRAIGEVKTNTNNGETIHSVDVVYDPVREEPQNLAHSQITVEPKFFGSDNKKKKAFKLLRIALARIATRNGWELEP